MCASGNIRQLVANPIWVPAGANLGWCWKVFCFYILLNWIPYKSFKTHLASSSELDEMMQSSILFQGSSSLSEQEQPTSGLLTSPNYPGRYPDNIDLVQKIQVPEGNNICSGYVSPTSSVTTVTQSISLIKESFPIFANPCTTAGKMWIWWIGDQNSSARRTWLKFSSGLWTWSWNGLESWMGWIESSIFSVTRRSRSDVGDWLTY